MSNTEQRSQSEFSTYLKQRRDEIEEALWTLVPEAAGFGAGLVNAIRYPLDAGGKRIRPVLTLIGSDFCRGANGADLYAGHWWKGVDAEWKQAILQAACSIEMIHTYSLVHDDLPCMDDDDLRRGRPTTHKVFGEAMAVLSGDALQTFGFQLLAEIPERFALRALRATRELALASGHLGMVAGQAVDLESENKAGDEALLEYIHRHKTAALIRASLLMGAHMADASPRDLEILSQVGAQLGLIFQVVDDILDVVGDTNELGKTAGADQKHGKLTYPSLIGLERSRERVNAMRDEALSLLTPEGERSAVLIDMTIALSERKA